jgi:hypothetical protein
VDAAVGTGIFVVEVEGARHLVVFIETAPWIIENDGVGVGDTVVGIWLSNTIRGGEVDYKARFLMAVERGIARSGVDDGALEGYFVVLLAGSEQQQDCHNDEFRIT